jgi:hypothetical protein
MVALCFEKVDGIDDMYTPPKIWVDEEKGKVEWKGRLVVDVQV